MSFSASKPYQVVLEKMAGRYYLEYEEDVECVGRTLGRVAGQIRNGRFRLDAQEFLLGLNAPPHHRDGGGRSALSRVDRPMNLFL